MNSRSRFPSVVWLGLGLIALTLDTADSTAASPETAAARSWLENRLSTADRLPFSFVYGQKLSAALVGSWNLKSEQAHLDPQRVEHRLSWTDPNTGLAVHCTATQYLDFPAVEWVLSFENRGTADTPILENIQALDTSFKLAPEAECQVHYAEGSHERITDFRPLSKILTAGTRLDLASFGGRSSDGYLPFFNLATSDRSGLVAAVGWTGQWAASFARTSPSELQLRAGMERTHLKLHPGEKIRMPAILLMFWSGTDRVSSQNQFRKLLLAHYTPRPGGRPVDPPVAISPHAEIGFEATTQINLLEFLGRVAAHKLPVDYFWIDAGWYDCQKNWARWVGTWQTNPQRYPHGLKPIADAAHQHGLKFLLWFEPERVMRDTWLAKNHPEWLFNPPPAASLPAEIRYMANDGFHLLDLGNPDARAWAQKTFGQMIRDLRIDAYRNDFNMYPLYYWRNADAQDRQGMSEIRYVTGLYDYFDSLVHDHPGLLLDTCASGGRRIDFEMLRRCLVLTRSDYLWDPVGQQCHTYGLAQWIPITGIGAASTASYECRSGMGAHYALAINTKATSPADWKSVTDFLNRYRSIRQLFQGDFYPLSPYSIQQTAWLAFQFDRPDLGQGVVQVFRRNQCPDESFHATLHGLDPASRYVLSDWDATQTRTVTGRELFEKGLSVRLPSKPGAAVIQYRKAR